MESKWIDCGKVRPDEYQQILLYCEPLKGITTGYLINGSWMGEDKKPLWYFPTHWMPLPKPPEHSSMS